MSAMKVTEFMLNLQKRLIDERKVSESTANQYMQTLWSLNGKKPFNNLAWTKKHDAVQATIDTYAKSTQLNQLAVLAAVLSLFADKSTYKGCFNYWKDKMMEYKKERDSTATPHEKSETQEDNWISWEDVQKKKSGLSEEISSFISTKNITSTQYDKLLQYVVLCLYTDIAPRRNQDYLDMYVVKKLGKDAETNRNYYDLATHRFVFNKYKTAKTYGQQIVDVPTELQTVIAQYLKFHPLAKAKTKEFKLIVKYDGSSLNTVNSITRMLNKIFEKKVGSSMLRHIFLSSKYGDQLKDMEEDAKAMSHSVSEQREYIKN
jgi:hypothetical protein